MNVRVQPEVLHQAADGINGVIGGLSGTPVVGSYTGQTGRGFSELELSGEQMSRASAKSGMDDFCERWEWGIRALVHAANLIAHRLHLGAGLYENQDRYSANALKDMGNDLVGDPSLQKESVRAPDGTILVRGTDDMSAGDVVAYNRDRLAHPDVSPESFARVSDDIGNSLQSMGHDLPQIARNGALNAVAPGAGVAMAAMPRH